MSDSFRYLLNHNIISPLSYYFAQFVAQQSGQAIDSLLCQTAALVSECNQQGDICINLEDYANKVIYKDNDNEDSYGIQLPSLKQWVKELSQYSLVSTQFELQPLILDGHTLYLGKLWHFEDTMVHYIQQRLNQPPELDKDLLKQGLARFFKHKNTDVDWQKVAASIVATQSFSVISGGPGTGKTTTLIKIIALLLEQNPKLNIQLCAPTGKAAIRMLEAINSRKNELDLDQRIVNNMPNDAKTIHRLLAYKQGKFSFNKASPLAIGCLIIDEASMIDFELMYHLISALPSHCKLILLGDKDQLSSVDAGHVFSDICGRGVELNYSKQQAEFLSQLNDVTLEYSNQSPKICQSIALLKTSYRFTQDSGIGQLASFVNEGDGKAAIELIKNASAELDFTDIDTDELPNKTFDTILKHYERVVSSESIEHAIEEFSYFQVLCAVRKGHLGIDAINDVINQRLYLRHKINSTQNFNGRPILITQNDYENQLFNGDIGVVWQCEELFYVYFQQTDGSLKSYPLISLNHYETAWAITVHKSQGSEYNNVLLVLPSLDNNLMVKRELIYTGITRAKLKFSLCSSAEVFIQGCMRKTQRKSGLAHKLGWE